MTMRYWLDENYHAVSVFHQDGCHVLRWLRESHRRVIVGSSPPVDLRPCKVCAPLRAVSSPD